ncbi:hypothetical protein [Streptomyces sp. TRM70350]|nr:hypothetical protein [Streptomyces sp. TRM70350]MBV7697279.1 hypothetical protein [Streptomyces sp. TRM70350]
MSPPFAAPALGVAAADLLRAQGLLDDAATGPRTAEELAALAAAQTRPHD